MTGGSCWTKDGRPKRRYATREDAGRARSALTDLFDNDPGQPYRCPRCDYFHLGHYPTNGTIRARLRRRHRHVSGAGGG